MKRTNLSAEQMDDIIRLRQTGSSWLGIEKRLGIRRRVAQRAYGKWEQARSTRELETARWEVSKAEFERHLDALTWLAEGLVTYLSASVSTGINEDAKTHLLKFLEINIPDSLVSGSPRTVNTDDIGRIRRRNELLFESLKEHSKDQVNWVLLEEWEGSWDKCYRLVADFQAKAEEIIHKGLSVIPVTNEKITLSRQRPKPLDTLAESLLTATLRGINAGEVAAATSQLETKYIEDAKNKVTLITIDERPIIEVDETGMDRDFITICNDVITEIWQTDICQSLLTETRRMREVVQKLSIGLEPLLLRPMILRTRCKICPV